MFKPRNPPMLACYLVPESTYPPDLTQESVTVKQAQLERNEIGIVSLNGEIEYVTVYCIMKVFDEGQSRKPTLEERLEVLRRMKDSDYCILPCSSMPCLTVAILSKPFKGCRT